MHTIKDAVLPDDLPVFRELMTEYLNWLADRARDAYGDDIDIPRLVDFAIAEVDHFQPPGGRFLIAWQEDEAAGAACIRGRKDGAAELRRTYVRPSDRGAGVGRQMVQDLIETARQAGYCRIVLDTPAFLTDARALYTALGFVEFEAPPEAQAKPFFGGNLVCLELVLDATSERPRPSG